MNQRHGKGIIQVRRCATGAVAFSTAVVLSACSHNQNGTAGGSTKPATQDTTNSHDNLLATTVLETYIGEYNGSSGQLTLKRIVPGSSGQVGQELVLSTLTGNTSGTTGTTTATTNTVLLHQLEVSSGVARGVDTACNTLATASGETTVPSSFRGVCFKIQAINGYTSSELIRTHVELTSLTNRNNSGTITTYVSAPTDSDFGVSGTLGLWDYGRLARSGVTGTLSTGSGTGSLDSASRNWYFATPEAGASSNFSFQLAVKAEVVAPIARATPTVSGTSCLITSSFRPAISANKQYIAFVSTTSGCRGGVGNAIQVFRYDTSSGTTTLVSHNTTSTSQGSNGANTMPSISSDGRFVAFKSAATDLLPSGTDAMGNSDGNTTTADIFVRDMSNDSIYIASVDDGTGASPVGFASDHPSISADGSYVAFETAAPIDICGGDTNSLTDVYRRDLFGGTTDLVSPNTGSRTQAATLGSIANGGSPVVFQSTDSSFVTGDTNALSDVFVATVATCSTSATRVSVTSTGTQGDGSAINGVVSADGSTVAFQSTSTNMLGTTTSGLNHIYVRRANLTGTLVRADGLGLVSGTEANADGTLPSLSQTGRMVVFNSAATNLDPLATAGGSAQSYMTDVRSSDSNRQRAFVISASETNSVASNGVNGVGSNSGPNANNGLFLSSSTNLVSGTPSGTFAYSAPLR